MRGSVDRSWYRLRVDAPKKTYRLKADGSLYDLVKVLPNGNLELWPRKIPPRGDLYGALEVTTADVELVTPDE